MAKELKETKEFTSAELMEIIAQQREALEVLAAQVNMQAAALGMAEVLPHTLDPKDHPSYIPHGSEKHAALLGLVHVDGDETKDVPTKDGWKLNDLTAYGVAARPEYLREVLRQKVSELNTPPPTYQSTDKRAPFYAPPMFQPEPLG